MLPISDVTRIWFTHVWNIKTGKTFRAISAFNFVDYLDVDLAHLFVSSNWSSLRHDVLLEIQRACATRTHFWNINSVHWKLTADCCWLLLIVVDWCLLILIDAGGCWLIVRSYFWLEVLMAYGNQNKLLTSCFVPFPPSGRERLHEKLFSTLQCTEAQSVTDLQTRSIKHLLWGVRLIFYWGWVSARESGWGTFCFEAFPFE